MSKFKKITAILLTVVLLVLSVATSVVSVSADETKDYETYLLSDKKIKLTTGEKCILNPKSKKAKEWKSSDKNIATVNKKGVVTAKKMGKVTITCKVGSKKKKGTVYVTSTTARQYKVGTKKSIRSLFKHIKNYKKGKWSVKYLTFEYDFISLDYGYTGTVYPSFLTDSKCISASKGNVNCKKEGGATIRLKVNGVTYSVNVYSYDKKKLKDKVIEYLPERLKYPDSLKIKKTKYESFKKVRISYSVLGVSKDRVDCTVVAYYKDGKIYYLIR